jgi:hypothetical protein
MLNGSRASGCWGSIGCMRPDGIHCTTRNALERVEWPHANVACASTTTAFLSALNKSTHTTKWHRSRIPGCTTYAQTNEAREAMMGNRGGMLVCSNSIIPEKKTMPAAHVHQSAPSSWWELLVAISTEAKKSTANQRRNVPVYQSIFFNRNREAPLNRSASSSPLWANGKRRIQAK